MNVWPVTRVAIQLIARIRPHRHRGSGWLGKTIEVGRNEVWVACKPSDFVSPPEAETGFVLSIELPVNESAGKRCMHCQANLAGVDPLDGGDVRLRFDIQTMSIRPCRRPRKEDEYTKLVM